MLNVGVLAMQGSVVEHMKSLSKIDGVNAIAVKTRDDLEKISGLIIPGGESTTIGKLICDFGIKEPIIKKSVEGMPIWGTCAGMILMAKEIVNEDSAHLGIMDVRVRRNAYGSQLDSFDIKTCIPRVSESEIELVFIRAPWVESVSGSAEVLATVENRIIAVQQNNLLATSFHPELTDNLDFHKYFIKMIQTA